MTDLAECLKQATTYWNTKRDGPSMIRRAALCVSILGRAKDAHKLTPADAIHVLARLQARGLSLASQGSYYGAFRRMLSLNGIATTAWPSGPVPPRRTREPLTEVALERLADELLKVGANETLDLLRVLQATGMRVDGEALTFGAWEFDPEAATLKITGKGGHERVIPVSSRDAAHILTSPFRFKAMMNTSYRTHSRKWKQAAEAAGITSKLPTPHAVRHYYATQAYQKCKDIRVVQDLLGHADYGTTARYIGVDIERMRDAVSAS